MDETKSKSMYKYESCKLNNDFVPFEPYICLILLPFRWEAILQVLVIEPVKFIEAGSWPFPSWKEQNEITFIASFTENLVTNLED